VDVQLQRWVQMQQLSSQLMRRAPRLRHHRDGQPFTCTWRAPARAAR
jgi:hypothetical protein